MTHFSIMFAIITTLHFDVDRLRVAAKQKAKKAFNPWPQGQRNFHCRGSVLFGPPRPLSALKVGLSKKMGRPNFALHCTIVLWQSRIYFNLQGGPERSRQSNFAVFTVDGGFDPQ